MLIIPPSNEVGGVCSYSNVVNFGDIILNIEMKCDLLT